MLPAATVPVARQKVLGEALMKTIVSVLILALIPALAPAAEKPDWAFPTTEKELPPPRIKGDQVRTIGSVSITRAKADDFYDIPNWRPDLHPPMPKIVQSGNKEKEVRACGSMFEVPHQRRGVQE